MDWKKGHLDTAKKWLSVVKALDPKDTKAIHRAAGLSGYTIPGCSNDPEPAKDRLIREISYRALAIAIDIDRTRRTQ